MSAFFNEDYESDDEWAYVRDRTPKNLVPSRMYPVWYPDEESDDEWDRIPKNLVPLRMNPDASSLERRYPADLEWGKDIIPDVNDGNFVRALDNFMDAFQENEAVVAEEAPSDDDREQALLEAAEEQASDELSGEVDLFAAADEQRRISALRKACLDKNGVPYDSYQSYQRAMIDAKRAVSRRLTPEEFEKYCSGNDAIEVLQKPELLQGAPPKWTKFETFAEVWEHYVTKKNRWPKGVPIKTKEGWERQKRLYLGLRDKLKKEQKEFQQQRRN